ncbi:MAG: hypothetical protein ICV68_10040, partial [Pyrinomonadaceae bacterium]|nr:hypothetical protein [Pyrinomonadaceae bacterium]
MLRRFATYFITLTLLATSLVPFTTLAAPAAPSQNNNQRRARKLAPELETATSGTVRVIIQSKGRSTAAQEQAVAAKGGSKKKTLEALNVLVADVPAGALNELAAREDIAYISPDRRVRAQMDVTAQAVGADLVKQGFAGAPGFTGKGVGIAVIDSGISANHPDFQRNGHSRVVAAVNFTNGSADASANGIL